jgi:enoyl-CoA hydratase/carnithine racemase
VTTESNSTTESRLVSVELDGTVGRLRLHRPAKRNALTAQMRQDLTIFLGQLASDDRVKVVTLMGDGGYFCSGYDRHELHAAAPGELRSAITADSAALHRAVAHFPKPLIAGIDGYALGAGFDIAMMCDIRIATERAQFGHVEVPEGGIALYTPMLRAVGATWARELCLTGRRIDSATANRIGVVSEVVSPEDLAEAVDREAQLVSQAALRTLMYTKSLFSTRDQTEEWLIREHDEAFNSGFLIGHV